MVEDKQIKKEWGVIEAAKFYFNNGFAVIPLNHVQPNKECSCGSKDCNAEGKHPRVPKWRDSNEETNEKLLKSQFKNLEWIIQSFHENDNIGIITGKASGVVVLDIDDSGGITVPEKAAMLFGTTYDRIPLTTLASRTGGGGLHIFYAYDPAFPPQKIMHNKDGIAVVLAEFKTDGNLVVEYPSNHKSGNKYIWIGDSKYNPVESNMVIIESIPEVIKNWLRGQSPKRDYSSVAPEGTRHDRLLKLAGALHRLKQPPEAIRIALRTHRDLLCASGGHRNTDKEIDEIVDWVVKKDTLGNIPQSKKEKLEEQLSERRFEEYSDQQLAIEFAKEYYEKIRWCSIEGRWYAFNAVRWVPEDVKITQDTLREFLRKQLGKLEAELSTIDNSDLKEKDKVSQKRELTKITKQLSSRRKFEDVLALAKAQLDISPTDFDNKEVLVNIRNGTIVLRNGSGKVEVRPHSSEDMLTQISNVEYDDTKDCPVWKKFLEKVQPDPDIRKFLQTWVGYCIFGHAKEEKIVVNTGSGGNGKNTFFNAIRYIFGDLSSVLDAEQFMEDSYGRSEYYKANMYGKRLVVASETRSKVSVFNDAFLKQLAGEETISGRHPYGKPFEFKMQAKANLLTNNLPSLLEVSPAIKRRLIILEWAVSIRESEVDRDLGSKLKSEASGILNWFLDGVKIYNSVGLYIPQIVIKISDENINKMDTFNDFFHDAIVMGSKDDRSLRSHVWGAYARWCKDMSISKMGRTAFYRRMEGIVECIFPNNVPTYRGMSIRDEYLTDAQREEKRQVEIREGFRRQSELTEQRKIGQDQKRLMEK